MHSHDDVHHRLARGLGRGVQFGGGDGQDRASCHCPADGTGKSPAWGGLQQDRDVARLKSRGQLWRPPAGRDLHGRLDLPAYGYRQLDLMHEVAVMVDARDQLAVAFVAWHDIETGLAQRGACPRHAKRPRRGSEDLEIIGVELHGELEDVNGRVGFGEDLVGKHRGREDRRRPPADAEGDRVLHARAQRRARGVILQIGQEVAAVSRFGRRRRGGICSRVRVCGS